MVEPLRGLLTPEPAREKTSKSALGKSAHYRRFKGDEDYGKQGGGEKLRTQVLIQEGRMVSR